MADHAWCRDVQRDEAVRAAEDGRSVLLPTLEECIADARAMMAKSVSGSSAPEPENKVDGIRTERITLEVTHDLDAPLGDWIVQVIDESLGYDESVRVVEECCLDRINMGEVIRERDAAIRERDELRADLLPRVASLESRLKAQPPARGWLTEEERDLIAGITDDDDYTDEGQNIATALIARSSPPEVVLPPMPDCSPMADYGAAWSDCLIAVRESLRRAGVKVQQPLPPPPEATP